MSPAFFFADCSLCAGCNFGESVRVLILDPWILPVIKEAAMSWESHSNQGVENLKYIVMAKVAQFLPVSHSTSSCLKLKYD